MFTKSNTPTMGEVIDIFYDKCKNFGKPWLICQVGSHAYGVNTPTSDYDYRGVFIPNLSHIVGLKEVKQVSIYAEDWVCQEIRHFISIVVKQNPTILELLFIEQPLYQDPAWPALAAELRKLITSGAFKPYNAYFLSQIKKAKNKQFKGSRKGNIEKYGYDPKFMSHTIRLGLQCCALMETGIIPVRLEGEDRQIVMDVKEGKLSARDVDAFCEELNTTMHYQYKHTCLPANQPLDEFENNVYIPLMKYIIENNRFLMNETK